MAYTIKDLARKLRENPGIEFPSTGNPADMRWIIAATIPREEFPMCVEGDTRERTLADFVSAPVNDTSVTWTADGESYELQLSVDGGAVTASTADHSRTIYLPSTATALEIAPVVAAGINSFPGIRSIVDAEKIGVYAVDDITDDITLAGDAVDSTAADDYTVSAMGYPKGYRPGQAYAKCEYMLVQDVWIDGSDDSDVNLVVMLQADIRRMSEDFDDIDFPAQGADDRIGESYPYGGDSNIIDWEFDLPAPSDYRRAPNGQAHPLYPNALLIDEQKVQSKGKTVIKRRYFTVGPESEQTKQGYVVTYECPDGVDNTERYPVVTITLDVSLATWTPAQPGSACPISGTHATGTNENLNFSTLKLVKSPRLEAINNVVGRATMEYRRLPSRADTTWRKLESPKNHKVYLTEFYVALPWAGEPAIGGTTTMIPGYTSNIVTSVEGIDPACLVAKVRIEHTTVPGAVTEYGSIGFRYPALYPAPISGWPPAATPVSGGRPGWSETTPCKIELSFTRTPDDEIAGGDPPVPANAMPTSVQFFSYLLRGVQDAIQNQGLTQAQVAESVAPEWWRMPDILHDTILIEDPDTGSTVVTVSASDPTATAYRTGITNGTFFIIKDTLTRWLGDIYIRTKISVKYR